MNSISCFKSLQKEMFSYYLSLSLSYIYIYIYIYIYNNFLALVGSLSGFKSSIQGFEDNGFLQYKALFPILIDVAFLGKNYIKLHLQEKICPYWDLLTTRNAWKIVTHFIMNKGIYWCSLMVKWLIIVPFYGFKGRVTISEIFV